MKGQAITTILRMTVNHSKSELSTEFHRENL